MMKVFQASPKMAFGALAPLSAGDLIDLAARIYRRQMVRLIRIVLPPGLISFAGLILISIGLGNFSTMRGNERVLITVTLILAGAALYLFGKLMFYALLGGVSRCLFNHYANGHHASGWNEAAPGGEHQFSAREVYGAVRNSVGALAGAAALLLVICFFAILITSFITTLVVFAYAGVQLAVLVHLPLSVQIISGAFFGLLVCGGLVWWGLLLYGSIVCVPQVMMVEGRGLFESIGRSFRLARGMVRQTGALLLFSTVTGWSIWILLVLPLIWYGYLEGIEINPFNPAGPLWYRVMHQALTPLSQILVAPVALVGYTLLYMDARIRKEGFDVEILAQRILSAPVPDPEHQPEGRNR
ncbi:MAG: hypothetical protein EBZ36_02620 [Acidobacteria bacterium]|nr:hypothetical protein [Acidobacteriota bacterium]